MAAHSSIHVWKSPWTEEPGGLQSMGLHDCATHNKKGRGRWVGSSKLVELKNNFFTANFMHKIGSNVLK